MVEHELAGGADEISRLRDFWDRRYATFELSESGWAGAGERFNRYVYRCKEHAVRAGLERAGLTPRSTFDVLDAGCGQGYFADFYARTYPSARYTGLDLSPRLIAYLKTTHQSVEFFEGNLATWRLPDRQFDVIQSLEVLHLVLDDALVAQMLANLGSMVRASGVILITVSNASVEERPQPYTRYRPIERMRAWWQAAGLTERFSFPMYYWLPDGGPRWTATRPIFFRLDPWILYVTDRLALRLRLPRATTGPDSRMHLVGLTRAIR